MSEAPRAVLFDLDGTLVDTSGDLAAALWAACDRFGRPRPSLAQATLAIGDGGPGLVRLAFGADAVEHDAALEHLLTYYADNIAEHSRVYEPLDRLLDDLSQRDTPWGVVTNKRAALARSLLGGLGVRPPADCIVGGDTLPVSKPDPAPLHHAAQLLGVDPGSCLYVGDHRRDIEAGRAAGMHCVAAAYGYVGGDESPDDWGAAAIADSPAALAALIEAFAGLPERRHA